MIPHSKTYIDQNDITEVNNQINSGRLTSGNAMFLFESELKIKTGIPNINVTVSGTFAFYKILLALELSKGDEILVPNYICNSILNPITQLGLNYKVYDNEFNSIHSSINEIEKKITSKTKVILINHTFGFPFKQVDTLFEIIPEGISIVEDFCHSLPFQKKIIDYPISTNSLAAFFSFNATKFIATGEGGAIASFNNGFIDKINSIRIGDNLSDLNSILGISQLRKIEFIIQRRKEIAEVFKSEFSKYLIKDLDYVNSHFFRFPIIVDDNKFFLNNEKVSYKLGVDAVIKDESHPQETNSDKLLKTIVSIPIYPALSNNEVEIIVENTKKLLHK